MLRQENPYVSFTADSSLISIVILKADMSEKLSFKTDKPA